MQVISAQEWQLTSFFEVLPTYPFADDPWPYTEVVYELQRDGLLLSCAIHPSHRDVRIILKKGTDTPLRDAGTGKSIPCGEGGPPYPWTRQIETIRVADEDAVTDDGAELLALLEERYIEDIIVMGVHTNICLLGRPYGIRQLVYWGKKPVLCRDLTDSFHRDARGHFWGTERTVAHIERYWCPSVTSDQLVGGEPFLFLGENARPSIAP